MPSERRLPAWLTAGLRVQSRDGTCRLTSVRSERPGESEQTRDDGDADERVGGGDRAASEIDDTESGATRLSSRSPPPQTRRWGRVHLQGRSNERDLVADLRNPASSRVAPGGRVAKVERGVLKSASGGARKVASTAHGTSSCEEGEFAAHSYAAQLGYNVGCVLLQGRPVNTRRVGDSPRPPTYHRIIRPPHNSRSG